MEGKKTYPKPKGYIFSTVYDMIELQRGEIILSDTRLGRLQYQCTMYDYIWELIFVITQIGSSKSEVSIRVVGERNDKAKEIQRQFALLDAMMEGDSNVKITDDLQTR